MVTCLDCKQGSQGVIREGNSLICLFDNHKTQYNHSERTQELINASFRLMLKCPRKQELKLCQNSSCIKNYCDSLVCDYPDQLEEDNEIIRLLRRGEL